MLAYGSESRADGVLFAPVFETIAPELTAFIADDVFRHSFGGVDGLGEGQGRQQDQCAGKADDMGRVGRFHEQDLRKGAEIPTGVNLSCTW